jgi:HEPN domain-containing protein
MDSKEKFEHWLNSANHDLEKADHMFNGGFWLDTAFYCQQAIEKLSKGLYIIYKDDNFPYIHNLKEIIERFEKYLPASVPKDIYSFVKELSMYYIKARYHEYKENLRAKLDKEKTIYILSTTKEVFSWLLTLKK